MPVFMAGMDHRTVWSSQCFSWTRFCSCPLLCYVFCIGPDSAVLAVPQLQFIKVVVLPVDTQRQFPMVLAVQMTISFTQLQLIDNVADVFVVHVVQVPQVQVVIALCVCGGGGSSPDAAYDSVWNSVLPTKGNTHPITSSTQTLLGVL